MQCNAHDHALGAANRAVLACMHHRCCTSARGQVLACHARGGSIPMLLLAARLSSLTSRPAAALRVRPESGLGAHLFVRFIVLASQSSTQVDSTLENSDFSRPESVRGHPRPGGCRLGASGSAPVGSGDA